MRLAGAGGYHGRVSDWRFWYYQGTYAQCSPQTCMFQCPCYINARLTIVHELCKLIKSHHLEASWLPEHLAPVQRGDKSPKAEAYVLVPWLLVGLKPESGTVNH